MIGLLLILLEPLSRVKANPRALAAACAAVVLAPAAPPTRAGGVG